MSRGAILRAVLLLVLASFPARAASPPPDLVERGRAIFTTGLSLGFPY